MSQISSQAAIAKEIIQLLQEIATEWELFCHKEFVFPDLRKSAKRKRYRPMLTIQDGVLKATGRHYNLMYLDKWSVNRFEYYRRKIESAGYPLDIFLLDNMCQLILTICGSFCTNEITKPLWDPYSREYRDEDFFLYLHGSIKGFTLHGFFELLPSKLERKIDRLNDILESDIARNPLPSGNSPITSVQNAGQTDVSSPAKKKSARQPNATQAIIIEAVNETDDGLPRLDRLCVILDSRKAEPRWTWKDRAQFIWPGNYATAWNSKNGRARRYWKKLIRKYVDDTKKAFPDRIRVTKSPR